jgi:5-formyltetrahydrofolate cyclo-ligase
MQKHELRREMRLKRSSLPLEQLNNVSFVIQSRFLKSAEYNAAKTVALYMPICSEISTELVLEQGLKDKNIVLPAVSADEMVFRKIEGLSDLTCGRFSIPEPSASCPVVKGEEIDLFVLPGVAFDFAGFRIGYGKGYYDRFLSGVQKKKVLVGFCFEFQLLELIPSEQHDVKVDMIITEQRIIKPGL